MLEINDFDKSRPSDARTPDKVAARSADCRVPGDLLAQAVAGRRLAQPARGSRR